MNSIPTEESKRKTMHINLHGARVDDYHIVKAFYGIENDNDLVRFLFSIEAKRVRNEFPLLTSASPMQRKESNRESLT